jgi:DNA-binding LacI/PurR family transcriptional regulator
MWPWRRQRLLHGHEDVTAFITLQEQSAIGLLRPARARDMRIPDDLSIVGTVNAPMAEMATPPLTTISFPADAMGRTGARLLLHQMNGRQASAEHVFVRPGLTVRGSSASPRFRP